jgi:hypothetical protein
MTKDLKEYNLETYYGRNPELKKIVNIHER